MEQSQIDELYHLLRVASNEEANPTDAFATQHAFYGLSRHLLAGGDYLSLVQYSALYGEEFLLKPTANAILETEWDFDRIVEFGSGLGWLARGLSSAFMKGYVTIDKRPWAATHHKVDLETGLGMVEIMGILQENDLIVMSDFLHCIEDPTGFVSQFPGWRMAALEYCPTNPEWLVSYADQIGRYGANPFTPPDFETMFLGRETDIVEMDPYILILSDVRKE